MHATPTQYAGLLLDAPFFTAPFSGEFMRILEQTDLYVPVTYEAVVAVFRDSLPTEERNIFQDNLNIVKHHGVQRLGRLDKHYNDILGAALHLSEQSEREGKRYLIATANSLLIQMVVLRQLRLDIYDLTNDTRIQVETFPMLSRQFEFKELSGMIVPTADIEKDPETVSQKHPRLSSKMLYKEELELYDESGQMIRLVMDQDIEDGFEAVMYNIPDRPGYIAKVFKPSHPPSLILNSEKLCNIHRLLELKQHPAYSWAKTPVQLLYKDPRQQDVVGFLMEKAEGGALLDVHPALNQENSTVRVGDTIRLCLDLATKLMCLGIYGFYVHDFNSNNFAWTHREPGKILMMDTDSFCSGDYFSTLQMPGFWYPKNREHKRSNKLTAIEDCLELAYIFEAWMLMRCTNALQRNGQLRDDEMWFYIPSNVRKLIQGALHNKLGHLPFYDALILELYKASVRPDWKGMTYQTVIAAVEQRTDPWLRPESAPSAVGAVPRRQTVPSVPPTPAQVQNTAPAGVPPVLTELQPTEAPSPEVQQSATALPVFQDSFARTRRMKIPQAHAPVGVSTDKRPDKLNRILARSRDASASGNVTATQKAEAPQQRSRPCMIAVLLLLILVLVVFFLSCKLLAYIHDLQAVLSADSLSAGVDILRFSVPLLHPGQFRGCL